MKEWDQQLRDTNPGWRPKEAVEIVSKLEKVRDE